ncbi:ADP-ribosylation factor 1 isoform X2 [Cucumis melo]|uniref:ADP-ribosylation factor 1 isoform X2 n=1 Tax=Cucumis melo TaxID=3656 RepID=A0ABM3KRU7_CUCME|nr:ADP-ribosylation factor 1 isoform X2 [Cucumis melo]
MLEKLQFSIGFRWGRLSPLFQQLGLMLKLFSTIISNSRSGILVSQSRSLPYWRCYFPNTQAIIYVVDSSDTDRLVVAREEFHAILEEEELRGAVALVFANKQDLPGALDDAAVTEALELHKIKNRQWAIFKASAIKGEGLFEGLDWLSNTLKSGGG